MAINGWRVMWVLIGFDCPVKTKAQRRRYTRFRNLLLKENFVPLQFSVYLKHMPTLAAADALINRVSRATPEDAHTVFFLLTDKQYGMTREFYGTGAAKKRPDRSPQLELF